MQREMVLYLVKRLDDLQKQLSPFEESGRSAQSPQLHATILSMVISILRNLDIR